jgi:hypothetical protein
MPMIRAIPKPKRAKTSRPQTIQIHADSVLAAKLAARAATENRSMSQMGKLILTRALARKVRP